MALLALIGSHTYAQQNNNQVTNILIQSSYHVDLPTYPKATLAVELLLEETTFSDQKILSVLDGIVTNPLSVELQVYRKYCGMPVYIDTGNPTIDRKTLNKAKSVWVKENPKKYKRLTQKD